MTKQLLLSLALGLSSISAMASYDVTAEKAAQNTPDGWTAVQLPNIPSTCKTVTVTGLSETGTAADNAAAIQTALNNVDNTNGTMVVIPAGTYRCNPISIRKDKTILHLSAGTTLKLASYSDYPSGKNFINNMNNSGSYATRYDIIIEGEGETSVIDGEGADWWVAVENQTLTKDRPAIISLTKGSRFLFRNFKIQNTPDANLVLGQYNSSSHKALANNMTVHDVTIVNPASTLGTGNASYNTDGIPMWGDYINIYSCNISTGGDNIAANSGTTYCHAWNLTFGAGHGASIGTDTENLNHIIYDGITFNNTETGLCLKTSNTSSGNSYDGTNTYGAVSDIIFRNMTMTGVLQPIFMTEVYNADAEDPSTIASSTVTASTPEFRNILFQNITSTGTAADASFKNGCPIYIYGRPESYIHDITFNNVSIEAQKGMFLAYCKDIKFNDCNISNLAGTGDYSKKYNTENITGNLTPKVALNTSGYATFSSAKDLSIKTSGVKAYNATLSGNDIILEMLNGYIPSGTGVLLYGNGLTSTTTVEFGAPAAGENAATNITGNILKPTSTGTSSIADYEESWALGDGNQFLKYTGTAFIANRAYIPTTVHPFPASGAKGMSLVFVDETTGVANVNANPNANQVRKGKYIENGRIVILKNGRKFNAEGQLIK